MKVEPMVQTRELAHMPVLFQYFLKCKLIFKNVSLFVIQPQNPMNHFVDVLRVI
uniref:Uncharacterized protein n=1 Tax=Anguilla anguilla TaxID=7936 RepID=A0A0E9RR22_ANGAN